MIPRIENLPLNLKPVDDLWDQLTANQKIYANAFRKGQTIRETVESVMAENRLVCFQEMFSLLLLLDKKNYIGNKSFKLFFDYVRNYENPNKNKKWVSIPAFMQSNNAGAILSKDPFFQSLPVHIQTLFIRNAQVVNLEPQTAICNQGRFERELFFLIEGEVALYKKIDDRKQLLGLLKSGAVIGEVGFFFGENRTVDVVATQMTKVVRIKYHKDFHTIMNKEFAHQFQTRIRLFHAFARSSFLSHLPPELLEGLFRRGQPKEFKENQKIFAQNDQGDSCFFITQGSVIIEKDQKKLNVLGSGELFGEIALLFSGGVRTASALAQKQTLCFEFKAKDFYETLAENILAACEFERLAHERFKKISA